MSEKNQGWLEKGEWGQFSLGSDEFEDPVPTRNKIPISRSTILFLERRMRAGTSNAGVWLKPQERDEAAKATGGKSGGKRP